LGDSEKLSIENAVGEPIPAFDQRAEDGAKVFASVRAEYPWDIFPNDPGGSKLVNNLAESEGQVTTVIVQSSSESCNAEALAGGSSDKKVNCSGSFSKVVIGDVSEVRYRRPMMRQHGARKLFNFGKPLRLPSEGFPGEAGGFDTRTY
tara:strand:+ start:122 stop:565 length:444 start_codon:yes stop_codon:yes gene_type:complete